MAAAYIRFYNGKTESVTKTGLTDDIKRNTPHGNPAGDQGVINKSPSAGSAVNGK